MRFSPGVDYTRVGESKKSGNRRCIKIPQKGHAGSGVCRTREREEDSRDIREESEKNEAGARAEAHRPQQLQCQRGLAGHTCKIMIPRNHQKNYLHELYQGKINFKQLSQIKVTDDTRIVKGQEAICKRLQFKSILHNSSICTLKKTSLLALLGT